MDPAAAPIANNLMVQYGALGFLIILLCVAIWALWKAWAAERQDREAERKEQLVVDREQTAALNRLAAVIEAGQRARAP